MKKKLRIGWQKYEDVIEKQLSSPLLGNILENIMTQTIDKMTQDYEDEDEDESYEDNISSKPTQMPMMVPMSQQLIEDVSMLSNYDCWVGHTNFDITPRIKDLLNTIDGIEVLKICSRYRFFIGIGQMFNFSEVRKNIEKELITKGDSYGKATT
ncbi:MAG: hypothetical protein EBU90_03870 [Proteobacteria bacterium]|nr:hypothetical protein [Pseudomonadota bacterium]NBP14207.1 hypothetical protein [bacterium]